jgi:nucleoside-diphosphate-sugar epimerase
MNNPEITHVVFGTGPLGRSVMNSLLKRRCRVRAVSRSGSLEAAPKGVELAAGNAADPAFVRSVTGDAAVVYQCAAPPYNRWREEFPALQNVLIEALSGRGTRLVIAENLYMYGDPDGQPLHEDLPYAAQTRKGRVRAELARAALQAHQDGRVQVAIGRGSDFFGPWVRGSNMGKRVFSPILAGKPAQLTGRADLPHSYTYIEDFGEALVLLGERPQALGQAWHVPNDRPNITQRQFMDLVGEALGRPVRHSTMGRGMMAFGGLFVPAAREMVEMMYEFEKSWVVDSGKFERTFGMKATPMPEAIARTLAWYQGAAR